MRSRHKQKPAGLEDRKPFERFPWWLRALSAIPLPVLHGAATGLAWLCEHVLRYRRGVVEAQMRRCFPDLAGDRLTAARRAFYRNFADNIVEVLKAVTISEREVHERVRLLGTEEPRADLAAGRSVIVVTSHHCNWEWALLALSRGVGHPVDAAYKPLHGQWGDRLFLTIRSRFGARMIPAKRLMMRVLRRRGEAKIVAMVADQDPVSATARYFTDFFGHETAFYMGLEAVARLGSMPVYYFAVRRVGRGRYTATLELLVRPEEDLPEGGIVERYARRVEDRIRESPGDWLWSYRRWKVRRGQPGRGTPDTDTEAG